MRRTFCFVLLAISLFPICMHAQASSWAHISEPIVTDGAWQSYVQDPAFSLGDTETIGTLADGTPLLSQAFGTYPRMDGSTVAVPMGMEIARQHLGLAEADLPAFVSFTTTHSAYENLIGRKPGATMSIYSEGISMAESHPVDLILATAPSEEELALAEETGVELRRVPFCLDAFIFIVHQDNPVDSLTVQQIQDIYAGRIVNWAEVGGEDVQITAYQREKNSGSQTAMEEMVMLGQSMGGSHKPSLILYAMSGLIEAVGRYDNSPSSIGYTYQYYLENLYPDENIKTLAIEGVQPTPENLRSGAYLFATHYYAVYRAGEEEAPGGLMADWLLSDSGQQSIRQAGYVPLREVEN